MTSGDSVRRAIGKGRVLSKTQPAAAPLQRTIGNFVPHSRIESDGNTEGQAHWPGFEYKTPATPVGSVRNQFTAVKTETLARIRVFKSSSVTSFARA
jgi:hypothetical protein